MSDGLPNGGEGLTENERMTLSELEKCEKLGAYVRERLKSHWNKHEPRVQIHTVGFYYESADHGAFLWALAHENEGTFLGMSKP